MNHAPTITSPPGLQGDDQATRLRALIDRLEQAERVREAVCAGSAQLPTPPAETLSRTPIVAIASGKGGVGKTNIAVNVAIALAQRGLRTALLDADLGVANADLLCGINPARRVDATMARADWDLSELAITIPATPIVCASATSHESSLHANFTLIPGSVGLAQMASLSSDDRQRLLKALLRFGARHDALIVDTGAGVGPLVTSFVAAADLRLIITTPEPTAIADAYALIKCLRAADTSERAPDEPIAQVVVNQAGAVEAQAVHARIDQVAQRFLGVGVGLAGWIRRDERLPMAVRARIPLLRHAPQADASVDLTRLGAQIAEDLSLGLSSDPLEHLTRTDSHASNATDPQRAGVLRRLIAYTFGR